MHITRRRTLMLAGPMLLAGLLLLGAWAWAAPARAQDAPDSDAATPTPVAEEAAPTPATPAADEEAPPEPSMGQSAEQSTRVLAAPAALDPGQPLTVTLAGDDDPAPMGRFLRYMLAGYGIQNSPLTITIGALPAGFPVTLTLPNTATVLGGTVQRGEYENSQLLIESAGPVDALQEELAQDLMARGYRAQEDDPGMSGQVFLSQPASMPEVLCSPDDRYSVFQAPLAIAGEPSVLRLTVNRASLAGGICSQDVSRRDQTTDILPQLAPPDDAQIRSTGGGYGGNSVSAEAEMRTSLTAPELAEHYMAQLETAGWEQLDTATTDATAWSGWRFTDEQDRSWTVTFYVVQLADAPETYAATLRAALQDD